MESFFERLRVNLRKSSDEVTEIVRMLDMMYKKFTVEHGLKLASPESFSTQRYEKDIERLRQAFDQQLNTVGSMLLHRKATLTQRFFDTIALEARRTFELANRDADQWLRAVMSPLETQVREYQLQLKRRLESVKTHPRCDRHSGGSGSRSSRRPRRGSSSSSTSLPVSSGGWPEALGITELIRERETARAA